VLDQPQAPFLATLNADRETHAASMRTAWANFAGNADPSAEAVRWPSFNTSSEVLSLALPRRQIETNFASSHPLLVLGGRLALAHTDVLSKQRRARRKEPR
jgi:carboxylesterase type B